MLKDILGGLLQDSTLWGIAIALVGGFILKKWPDFPNKFIPIATMVVAVVTQFINFFSGAGPGTVPVVPTVAYMTAGIFDSGIFKAIIAAVLQWVITDNTYQSQKKAVEGLAVEEPKKKK